MTLNKPSFPRLFVALQLPCSILRKIEEINSWFPELRFSGHPHLTLRFIGQGIDAEKCIKCLQNISFSPFELRLASAGTFGGKILWVAPARSSALVRLKTSIDMELEKLGLPRDDRVFIPHITLCRLKSGLAREAKKRLFSMAISGRWTVTHYNLYESVLRPSGAIHKILRSYPLD